LHTRWQLWYGAFITLAGLPADFAFGCRDSKMGSNMIVFEIDSLFSDFSRFVIVSFFVDPPAVGPVFPFAISQIIAVLGTCQKAGDQQNDDHGRRDEPAFCDERSHEGTNPLALSFIFIFGRFAGNLTPFSDMLEPDRATGSTIMPPWAFSARMSGQYI
jgi:hypothetical protein